MIADDFYIAEAGQTKGPYSMGQLKSMWDQGLITSDTQYWREGLDDWHLLEMLFETESQDSQPDPAKNRQADTATAAVSPKQAPSKAPLGTPQSSARIGVDVRENSGGGWIIVSILIIMFAVVLYALHSRETNGSFDNPPPEQSYGDDVDSYVSQAEASMRAEDIQQAVSAYEKAIGINRSDSSLHVKLGMLCLNYYLANPGVGDSIDFLYKAHEAFNKAIHLNASSADAYLGRGIVFDQLVNPEQALADLNKAIELAPKHAAPYKWRGDVFYRMQRPAQAISDYTKALEIQPNYAAASAAREQAQKEIGKPTTPWTAAESNRVFFLSDLRAGDFVTLRKPLTIQYVASFDQQHRLLTMTLRTGAHVQIVSRNGDNVRIHITYNDYGIYADYDVPVDIIGPDDR